MDHLYDYLIRSNVHPNYVKLSKLLTQDNIKSHADFARKYGEDGFNNFKNVYMGVSV